MDNDSRMFSLAGLLTRTNGDVLEPRRCAGSSSIATAATTQSASVPLDLDNVELRYSRGLGAGKISVGVGYDDPATSAGFILPRARFRELATRILMLRGLSGIWRR